MQFETIFSENATYVLRTLRRLGVSSADLEDVAQEVFVAVHNRLPDFDKGRPVAPWLFGFAYRKASDYRRLARHRREVMGVESEPSCSTRSPERLVEDREAHALVLRALDAIPMPRRAVFILHDVEGNGMKEIAEELGIPLHTGYSRLRKARAEFAEEIRRAADVAGPVPSSFEGRAPPDDQIRERLRQRLIPLLSLGGGAALWSAGKAQAAASVARQTPGLLASKTVAWTTAAAFVVGGIGGSAVMYGTTNPEPRMAETVPHTASRIEPVAAEIPAADEPIQPVAVAEQSEEQPGEPEPRRMEVASTLPSRETPRSTNETSSLSGERTLIQRARTAVARSRRDDALAALAEHAALYPDGQLREERESLRRVLVEPP